MVRQLELVAPTDATVLLPGESGTGKELVARRSPRSTRPPAGPFVAINCAAIPESLLESELFGHEKGAFTGADRHAGPASSWPTAAPCSSTRSPRCRPGSRPSSSGSSRSGEFRRVGGTPEIRVDVRVIAATNQRPASEPSRAGRFREDLYYRLNVFAIRLPPLRDRPEDIPALVRVSWRVHPATGGPSEASTRAPRRALFRYPWPGNVRELRNVLERAIILCSGDLLGLIHLPVQVAGHQPPPAGEPGLAAAVPEIRVPVGTTVDDAERQLIIRTLAHAGNNKTRAAEVLGISLKTLHNGSIGTDAPRPAGTLTPRLTGRLRAPGAARLRCPSASGPGRPWPSPRSCSWWWRWPPGPTS